MDCVVVYSGKVDHDWLPRIGVDFQFTWIMVEVSRVAGMTRACQYHMYELKDGSLEGNLKSFYGVMF